MSGTTRYEFAEIRLAGRQHELASAGPAADALPLCRETAYRTTGATVARISMLFQRRCRGIETKLVHGYEAPKVDAVLLHRVARGYAWWDEIRSGKATFKDIVKREKLSRRFVAIHLDLAFLSPDLMTSVLEGTQPIYLSAQMLRST